MLWFVSWTVGELLVLAFYVFFNLAIFTHTYKYLRVSRRLIHGWVGVMD